MVTLLHRPIVRVAMIGIVLLALQTTMLAELRPFGVSADIMLGASVCAGIVAGAEQGAMVGFVYGVMFDLLLVSPLGLSAFAYGIAAFSVGALKALITVGQAWWLTVMLIIAGSGGGIVLFAFSGALIGQQGWVRLHLVGDVLVIGGVNALIGLPLSALMKWALRVEREQ
jgi:rod shape-determining protein MreD